MSFTTTDLIASIKRRGSIPTSQILLQNSDFLALSNEELQIDLVPEIMAVRASYFIANFDYTPNATGFYLIPSRAIGGKLLDVQIVTSSSIISQPFLEERDRLSSNQAGFFIIGNYVQLGFTPDSTATVRLVHYRRPNSLVQTIDCGQVTAINTATNTVTVSSLPSTMLVGSLCDFVQNNAPFDSLAIDQSITNVSGTDITFSATLPTSLAIGDWISIAQTSPIPQIPQELHSVLAQMVTVKCLESMGDQAGVQIAQAKLDRMRESTLLLISPRVDDEPKKIANRNGLLANIKTHGRRFIW